MQNSYNFQYDPQRDLSQIFEDGAKECPGRIAIICGEHQITYFEMNRRINKLANALLKVSGNRRLHIGIISKNCIEYMELFLACARARMVAVNMNWRCTVSELNHLVRQTKCQMIFYNFEKTTQRMELGKNLLKPVSMVSMASDGLNPSEYETFLQQGADTPVALKGDPSDVFSYYHTSGSTGVPKIVVFTHGNLLKKIRILIEGERFEYGMVFQVMTQLFHAGSLGNYMCLACRGTLIIFNHFDADAYLASLERHQVQRITVAPSTLRALLYAPGFSSHDLSHLKYINYSMAPMPAPLISHGLALLPDTRFMGIYGMTEMAGGVTVLDHHDHFSRNGRLRSSVGLAMKGLKVRIADEEGAVCPPGKIGEITISGYGMMKEYYDNPQATAMAIKDGWFYSNDMGYMDENGYLFLCGRRSNMIITGGENVFSAEVESVLLEHPRIQEAAVFGLPDDTWGERVCACVVLKGPAPLGRREIQDFCRQRIAGYKIPKSIFTADALPRSAVGKILHRSLTEQYSKKHPD